jgi:hypothetical protein
MSCAEQVENDAEPTTIMKSLHLLTTRSGFLLCKKRYSRLIKMTYGILCAFLNTRRLSDVSGYLKESKVCLLKSLRGLKQG